MTPKTRSDKSNTNHHHLEVRSQFERVGEITEAEMEQYRKEQNEEDE